MKQIHISLEEIIVEDDIVARAEMNGSYLADIENDLKDGAQLPPVSLFLDATKYYLVDGLHRLYAAKNLKQEMIVADIRKGSRRDAILFSCKVNSEHGLRRTRKDKRKAVKKLLTNSEWNHWSDGKIAKQCAVTQPFVSKVRRELTQNDFESPTNRKGKDGRTYNTDKIGRSKSSEDPDFTEDKDSDENTLEDSLVALTRIPVQVDDLISADDLVSRKDETDQIDSKDSSYEQDTDNDLNTDSNEQQDEPIRSSKQIAKLAEQIAVVTSKLSKIIVILENQSSKTGSNIKRLKKLKGDLEGAWINLISEFEILIQN